MNLFDPIFGTKNENKNVQLNVNVNYDSNKNNMNNIDSEFYDLRYSLNNNLIRGDYLKALDKISDNLTNIRNNIKELRNYLINIGSKRDNRALNEQVNQQLLSTGNLFKESIILIKDFKEFKFPNKNDQTANLRQLRLMESKCSDMKQEYESLTYKINRQNKSIIESIKNSKSNSRRISLGPDSNVNYNPRMTDDYLDNKQQQLIGDELLAEDKLVEKEKQNIIIEK